MLEFIKKYYWGINIIFFIILLLLCLYLLQKYNSSDRYISVIGSLASLFGILVAIGQILSVRSKTDLVESAVEKTRTQIENLSIFTDFNKQSQFINEIQVYIIHKNYDMALHTYKDLKERLNLMLGYIENRKDLEDFNNQLRRIVDSAGDDVKNLQKVVVGDSQIEIDTSLILNNLENTKTFLDKSSGSLKSKQYEK